MELRRRLLMQLRRELLLSELLLCMLCMLLRSELLLMQLRRELLRMEL